MSIAELKKHAARSSRKQQRELIAFLVSLQSGEDEAFKGKLAAKIDDPAAGNWIELNDVRKRYGE